MSLESFINAMPKVELHVHLEGAIQPHTLLKLAERNNVPLPAATVEELQAWYEFTGFMHFAEVYQTLSKCLCTVEDIELVARDFLLGQAAQNIIHTEATYTAWTHYRNRGLAFADQLAAINRAREWAARELNVTLGLVIDIPREYAAAEDAELMADWVIGHHGNGVVAFGIGGYEVGFPLEKFAAAFAKVKRAGVPSVPHAGETEGPASIWSALRTGNAVRLGHGVRCLEDAALVAELRLRQIPLEVCTSSNVCLKVAPDLASHPLPRLLQAGLLVTINSDDPPMFNTTLTDEWLKVAEAFQFSVETIERLSMNAAQSALLPEAEKQKLNERFQCEFALARQGHSV